MLRYLGPLDFYTTGTVLSRKLSSHFGVNRNKYSVSNALFKSR